MESGRVRTRIVAAAFALLLVAVAGGCGGDEVGPADRILLVGIDSADWDVVEPLMAEGRLPNLRALVESGVSCDLHSLEPKQKSPTIWTTIATGKLPEKHGITDYVDPLDEEPHDQQRPDREDLLGHHRRARHDGDRRGLAGQLAGRGRERLHGDRLLPLLSKTRPAAARASDVSGRAS